MRLGTVLIVNRAGSRAAFICGQVSSMETVAPGRALGDNGATAVAVTARAGIAYNEGGRVAVLTFDRTAR